MLASLLGCLFPTLGRLDIVSSWWRWWLCSIYITSPCWYYHFNWLSVINGMIICTLPSEFQFWSMWFHHEHILSDLFHTVSVIGFIRSCWLAWGSRILPLLISSICCLRCTILLWIWFCMSWTSIYRCMIWNFNWIKKGGTIQYYFFRLVLWVPDFILSWCSVAWSFLCDGHIRVIIILKWCLCEKWDELSSTCFLEILEEKVIGSCTVVMLIQKQTLSCVFWIESMLDCEFKHIFINLNLILSHNESHIKILRYSYLSEPWMCSHLINCVTLFRICIQHFLKQITSFLWNPFWYLIVSTHYFLIQLRGDRVLEW